MIFSANVRLLFTLGGLGLLSSCDKVCDKDDTPQNHLTAAEQSWTQPYAVNSEWRFHNAAGYERVYRVTKREDEMKGEGGGKGSFCPNYYNQHFAATIERQDSASKASAYSFLMSTKVSVAGKPFSGSFLWNSTYFALAIDEMESGFVILGNDCEMVKELTINGHAYQQVLKAAAANYSGIPPKPTDARFIYLTKEAGVVRVVERGGTVWDRQ